MDCRGDFIFINNKQTRLPRLFVVYRHEIASSRAKTREIKQNNGDNNNYNDYDIHRETKFQPKLHILI